VAITTLLKKATRAHLKPPVAANFALPAEGRPLPRSATGSSAIGGRCLGSANGRKRCTGSGSGCQQAPGPAAATNQAEHEYGRACFFREVGRATSRRAFIDSVAGGLLVTPFIIFAQQPAKVPRIGVFGGSKDGPNADGFRRALRDLGYTEGRNITVEWRWSEGRPSGFPTLRSSLFS
jgi:hypothetical protein